MTTADISLHTPIGADRSVITTSRERGFINIGRLQVRIENCEERIRRADSEAEAAPARSSLELYRGCMQAAAAILAPAGL